MSMHPDLSAALTLLQSATKTFMANPEFQKGNSTHHFATHQVGQAQGHLVCLDVDIVRMAFERQQLLDAIGAVVDDIGPYSPERARLRALYRKLTNPQQQAAQPKEN